jgi:hypothetical protein
MKLIFAITRAALFRFARASNLLLTLLAVFTTFSFQQANCSDSTTQSQLSVRDRFKLAFPHIEFPEKSSRITLSYYTNLRKENVNAETQEWLPDYCSYVLNEYGANMPKVYSAGSKKIDRYILSRALGGACEQLKQLPLKHLIASNSAEQQQKKLETIVLNRIDSSYSAFVANSQYDLIKKSYISEYKLKNSQLGGFAATIWPTIIYSDSALVGFIVSIILNFVYGVFCFLRWWRR